MRSVGMPSSAHARATASSDDAANTQKMTPSVGTARLTSTVAEDPSAAVSALPGTSRMTTWSVAGSMSSARYHSARKCPPDAVILRR